MFQSSTSRNRAVQPSRGSVDSGSGFRPRRSPRAALSGVFAAFCFSLAATEPTFAVEPISPVELPASGAPSIALGHAAVFLVAAQTVTPLSVPVAASILAPSPFVASLISDERCMDVDEAGFAVRNHAPESWFVDSIVCGLREGLYESSDRDFTRDAVLDGPRFFAREARFDFTPRGDSEQIEEDRHDADRRLFLRAGADAMRSTLVQSDVYYHVFRHVNDVDFHLFFSPTSTTDSGRPLRVVDSRNRSSDGEDVLTRLDVKFKPSRVFDDSDKIVQIEGWVFDLVEFSVYPTSAEASLRVPLFKRRSLSLDFVAELEGPGREGVVFLSVTSRF